MMRKLLLPLGVSSFTNKSTMKSGMAACNTKEIASITVRREAAILSYAVKNIQNFSSTRSKGICKATGIGLDTSDLCITQVLSSLVKLSITQPLYLNYLLRGIWLFKTNQVRIF
jgi:hypothetical protein